jgi:hypothetical protein
MSIVRKGGYFIPTCDICGDELLAQATFQDAVQAKRDARWKTEKTRDGTYEDACRTCQNGGVEPD